MKTLSVMQPFASLIMGCEKSIETRTWETQYRGDLLICSSKSIHDGRVYIPLPNSENGQWMNSKDAIKKWPGLADLGMMLCVVEMWDCKPMLRSEETEACCAYYTGAFSWHLRNVRPVEMIPIKGQLGLFETPDGFIKFLFNQK